MPIVINPSAAHNNVTVTEADITFEPEPTLALQRSFLCEGRLHLTTTALDSTWTQIAWWLINPVW